MNLYFSGMLETIGIKSNHTLMVHSSYKAIKSALPEVTAETIIDNLKSSINPIEGSIIMPAFTYCFKRTDDSNEIFDRLNSRSKVGYISEVFRTSSDVERTSSPTHSFSMWGKIKDEISQSNNPDSPLGENSVLAYLSSNSDSYVLMLGTDFTSFTFGHYLEIQSRIPWYDYSPWEFMGVENVGVSTSGKIALKEIPGCAKSFINFENYLLQENIVEPFYYNNLRILYIPVAAILEVGIPYFKTNYPDLLCKKGTCQPCDSRRNIFLP